MSRKKIPSSREYQLLAALLRHTWTAGANAELNGRQIARAYEAAAGELIPSGTVYTLLNHMEGWGWMQSREDLFEGRRTRWYRIKRPGLAAVDRWRYRSSTLLGLTTRPPKTIRKKSKRQKK